MYCMFLALIEMSEKKKQTKKICIKMEMVNKNNYKNILNISSVVM